MSGLKTLPQLATPLQNHTQAHRFLTIINYPKIESGKMPVLSAKDASGNCID